MNGPTAHKNTEAVMITSVPDEVQMHTDAVLDGSDGCTFKECPQCHKQPEGFSRHDCRKRTVLRVVEGVVYKLFTLLTRWLCPLCNHTFTMYPRFVLRHKRYVADTVLEKSATYVQDHIATYRSTIKEGSLPIAYDATPESPDDGRQLAPSTLHRWLTTLGGLHETLRNAFAVINAACSATNVFRAVPVIAPWKYRSEQRRLRLRTAATLLRTGREYQAIFGVSIFPHFATTWGWI